jgi:class 3 adenylate cyclase
VNELVGRVEPRIAAQARGTGAGLLISAATRDALRSPSSYSLREVGAVVLQSGADPVELLEVVETAGS